jgi:hypothetical protein
MASYDAWKWSAVPDRYYDPMDYLRKVDDLRKVDYLPGDYDHPYPIDRFSRPQPLEEVLRQIGDHVSGMKVGDSWVVERIDYAEFKIHTRPSDSLPTEAQINHADRKWWQG